MKKFALITLLALTLFSGLVPMRGVAPDYVQAADSVPEDLLDDMDYAGQYGLASPDVIGKIISDYQTSRICNTQCQTVRRIAQAHRERNPLLTDEEKKLASAAGGWTNCWIGESRTSRAVFGCQPQAFLIGVYNLTNSILGELMRLFGGIFDYIVNISITQFSNFAGTDAGFITAGWRIIRNICNIFFIFILLFTALKTVLGMEGDTKRAVIRVVLCALLINFSLAGAKLVIDAGNATALYFYNASKGGANGSLGLQVMKVTKVVDRSGVVAGKKETTTSEIARQYTVLQLLVKAFTGFFFYIVVLLILIAASGMFIVRLVTLMWLLLTAPWPVLYYAYKGSLGDSANDWMQSLIGQTFMAPVFFILFYISLTVATKLNSTPLSRITTFSADTVGTSLLSSIQDLISFLIVVFLFFAVLQTSQKMAGKTGGAIAGWADKKIKETGQKAGAWAGRNSLARPARAITGFAGDKLAGRQGLAGAVGRMALRGSAAADSAGFGVKGGSLHEVRETEVKQRVEEHKRLGEVDKAATEQKARKEADRTFSDPATVAALAASVRTAEATASADRDREIDKDLERAAKEQGFKDAAGNVDIAAFERGNSAEAARIREKHTKRYSSAGIREFETSKLKQSLLTRARTGAVGEGKEAAARRQSSFTNSLATGGLLGHGPGPTQGLFSGADFEALGKIDTARNTEDKTGERIKGLEDRLKELNDTEIKDAQAAVDAEVAAGRPGIAEKKYLSELKDRRLTLTAQLEQLNAAKKAAEAKAT